MRPNILALFLALGLSLGNCSTRVTSENDSEDPQNPESSATGPSDSVSGTGSGGGGTISECEIFPPDNPWNTDISNYTVHEDSDAYITKIASLDDSRLHPDFGTTYLGNPNGIPYMVIEANQALAPILFTYAAESDVWPGAGEYRYPIPENPLIEAGGGDRHILLLQRETCLLFEIFAAENDETANCGSGGWCGGSGAIFDLTSNDLRPDGWTSADAAGLPILPGLIRYEEVVEEGEIPHALRFTVPQSQPGHIYPARHHAGSCSDCPPMGLRLRLKSDADLSACIDDYLPIMVALQKYGMFMADNGGNMFISGAPNPNWNDDALHTCFRSFTVVDFEVVDTGPIVTASPP